ncbi:Gfo/Idh/MocA family protein [Stratiformator vulcanicus]|uniref:Putative oxidoreductase YcjS n=1 Tax=Stratiformator vulcanicus TaxID=2527980 RepID=A0A517QYV9_9PLAN|nr:Gfo/Idh/MocA family oxidoreductase [Stratiformator vulcanicus]QDT36783.1 putative oxidoreductase YcjS [Stratiformator vulcanicus]
MADGNFRVLCVGAGHMGRSHALAYHALDNCQIVGLCTRSAESREGLLSELNESIPGFDSFKEALATTNPDIVSISSYTETHFDYAKAALEAGCHVFVEKPLAESVEQAVALVDLAQDRGLKMVVGYILRHNPAWRQFIEVAKTLGKPLVMRMNLNQQSSGSNWETHKNLMSSVSPIVDCGVHYVDVMCQMTGAKPVRVSGIGARLTEELPAGKINYGHLQVTFDDGSVGWYEAGWGPMMSETAFFVKDVVGPRGSVSINATKAADVGSSADVDSHTQTEALLIHQADLRDDGSFASPDEILQIEDEPDHDELCRREQQFLVDAIQNNVDLSDHLADAVNSMRIVEAADRSFREGRTVDLQS